MSALEDAGYLTATKTTRGRGGVTSYRISKAGAAAFKRHIAALTAIVSTSA